MHKINLWSLYSIVSSSYSNNKNISVVPSKINQGLPWITTLDNTYLYSVKYCFLSDLNTFLLQCYLVIVIERVGLNENCRQQNDWSDLHCQQKQKGCSLFLYSIHLDVRLMRRIFWFLPFVFVSVWLPFSRRTHSDRLHNRKVGF